MRERIITLGKALIEELSLEPGVDTLSKWMAHYVAEQIVATENVSEEAKSEAERQCFETVLKMWQHRSTMPSRQRPFEKFEPIFRALDRLDPENDNSFYFQLPYSSSTESADAPESIAANVQNWIDIALAVDRAARVLIDVAFHQAARSAADEKTRTWLKNAAGLPDGEDRSVVIRLLSSYQDDDSKEGFERSQRQQEGTLRSKIDKLDVFSKIATSLRATLTADLERISKEGTSTEGNDLV